MYNYAVMVHFSKRGWEGGNACLKLCVLCAFPGVMSQRRKPVRPFRGTISNQIVEYVLNKQQVFNVCLKVTESLKVGSNFILKLRSPWGFIFSDPAYTPVLSLVLVCVREHVLWSRASSVPKEVLG